MSNLFRTHMKTKEKVIYWLNRNSSLKDDDNRLCANIWAEEIKDLNITARDFLKLENSCSIN